MRFALAVDSIPVAVVQSAHNTLAVVVQEVALGAVWVPDIDGFFPAFSVGGMNRPVVGHNDYTYFTCRF